MCSLNLLLFWEEARVASKRCLCSWLALLGSWIQYQVTIFPLNFALKRLRESDFQLKSFVAGFLELSRFLLGQLLAVIARQDLCCTL